LLLKVDCNLESASLKFTEERELKFRVLGLLVVVLISVGFASNLLALVNKLVPNKFPPNRLLVSKGLFSKLVGKELAVFIKLLPNKFPPSRLLVSKLLFSKLLGKELAVLMLLVSGLLFNMLLLLVIKLLRLLLISLVRLLIALF